MVGCDGRRSGILGNEVERCWKGGGHRPRKRGGRDSMDFRIVGVAVDRCSRDPTEFDRDF